MMRERQIHRGRSLYLWKRDGAWLWLFADGGAIGAAASKRQALKEGRSAIDEFLGRGGDAETVRQVEVRFETQPRFSSRPAARHAFRKAWNSALDGLARYLATA